MKKDVTADEELVDTLWLQRRGHADGSGQTRIAIVSRPSHRINLPSPELSTFNTRDLNRYLLRGDYSRVVRLLLPGRIPGLLRLLYRYRDTPYHFSRRHRDVLEPLTAFIAATGVPALLFLLLFLFLSSQGSF